MVPKWPQNGPRWPQHGPKVIPEWSQNGPSMAQKWSRTWSQHGSKMVPKWSQIEPNMAPKWSKNSATHQGRSVLWSALLRVWRCMLFATLRGASSVRRAHCAHSPRDPVGNEQAARTWAKNVFFLGGVAQRNKRQITVNTGKETGDNRKCTGHFGK